jgi:hypothetical protein
MVTLCNGKTPYTLSLKTFYMFALRIKRDSLMRLGRPADGIIGQIWSLYIVAKYLSFTLMSSSYIKFNICMYFRRLIWKYTPQLSRALPGGKVGIHFALCGVLFSPVAWPCRWALYVLLGSVAKRPKFRLQNIKRALQFFSKSEWAKYMISRTFWLIWQNTF